MTSARLSAGGNLNILVGDDHWRLTVNGGGVERVLVEAAPGQPLRYAASFGTQRRLPAANILPTDLIEQVVVGWSARDEAWHLGVILLPPLSEERGSRWVDIAFWPDRETTLYRDDAVLAGERLAQLIRRPFTIAQAKPDATSASAARPMSATMPPLIALPIRFDSWTLTQHAPALLVLQRSPAWGRRRLLRTLWYTVLAAAFALLSILSLTAGIAPPRISPTEIRGTGGELLLRIPAPPEQTLIVVGLICAVLLFVLALITYFGTLSAVKRIAFDGEMRAVRAYRAAKDRRPVWNIASAQLDAVYASVIVTAINPRRAPTERKAQYGELSLLEKRGRFHFLAALTQFEQKIPVTPASDNHDHVRELTASDAPTALHAAALHIARALDIPARIDQRTR
jgi:hypothetical protein